jgi:hypothetical protein
MFNCPHTGVALAALAQAGRARRDHRDRPLAAADRGGRHLDRQRPQVHRLQVEFLPSARVSAEVSAPRVVMADGARFGGRIDMKNTEAAVRVARYRLEKKLGAR